MGGMGPLLLVLGGTGELRVGGKEGEPSLPEVAEEAGEAGGMVAVVAVRRWPARPRRRHCARCCAGCVHSLTICVMMMPVEEAAPLPFSPSLEEAASLAEGAAAAADGEDAAASFSSPSFSARELRQALPSGSDAKISSGHRRW